MRVKNLPEIFLSKFVPLVYIRDNIAYIPVLQAINCNVLMDTNAVYYSGNSRDARRLIMLVTRCHVKHMQHYEYLNWTRIVHGF